MEREELRRKVRSRLAQLAQRINRRVARRQRDAAREGPPSVSRTSELAGVLGQQAGAAAGPAGGGANNADDDYGPALVELIQTTIAPATWDVNGGPGGSIIGGTSGCWSSAPATTSTTKWATSWSNSNGPAGSVVPLALPEGWMTDPWPRTKFTEWMG